jgi:hypothetical protein
MEPFFIIILIWIVSSVFNGLSGQQKKKPSTPPFPIPPKPGNLGQEPVRQEPRPEVRQTRRERPVAEPKLVQETVLEKSEERSTVARRNALEKEMKRLQQQYNKQKDGNFSNKQNFNKNKVVDGIIWSEILGPPRAKKPFSRK